MRGDTLRKEAEIHTWGDLLTYYPLRHIDRTRFDSIRSLNPSNEYAQVSGIIISKEVIGSGRSKRLIAMMKDNTGLIELVWFQGINWVQKNITIGQQYVMFGKVGFFNGKPQMVHPDTEVFVPGKTGAKNFLEPIYPSTEKLKAKGITNKILSSWIMNIFSKLPPEELIENIPDEICKKYKLMNRQDAVHCVHFPPSPEHYKHAVRRLKFEELFFAQLRIRLVRVNRKRHVQGWSFDVVGDLFNDFYKNNLPFELTNAQKRVIKEIRKDTASGKQMNRLLQGDVGSGKTIVALLCMLMAIDNGFQTVMMAPTEVLAQQHYASVTSLLKDLQVKVKLLTGSTSTKERKVIIKECEEGTLNLLIGTHAVIEDEVKFANLGFAVVDEQHKFGVAQRARLWEKNTTPPHVLIMTATPIPRTLALTAYGDLDYSVMDELPPGRKEISTVYKSEMYRAKVMQFVRSEIEAGRQAYFIYPLIEESKKVNYENLMQGYEEVKSFFPEPKFFISMVHGKQSSIEKETNMQRFITGDTHILVGTTVIEVGVNVPNATVMVIESAEKFGLSQLHQLRGRVGRGSEASYCILLTGPKVSKDAVERLQIMTQTNDGFKIAEKDLELRGPGEIDGTKQSGLMNFKLANLVADRVMVEVISEEVDRILDVDAMLSLPEHQPIKDYLHNHRNSTTWSKIA